MSERQDPPVTDQPGDDPQTHEQTSSSSKPPSDLSAREKGTSDEKPLIETTDLTDKTDPKDFPHPPGDHSGEPLHVHSEGGGSGEVGGSGASGAAGEEEEEEEDGPQSKSKGEGTGERYVKSTGLESEGGDFDATAPGAGREANRLLDEKGIHHGGPDDGGSSAPTDTTGKPGVGDKIKDKLHLGHK